MGAVLPPSAKLPFPYDATARGICVPRSYELLDLHVDATENMESEVLFVDEVGHVRRKLLIEQKRDTIVRSTYDSEVDELLASSGFAELDGRFVSRSSFVHAVDVPPGENDGRPRGRLSVRRSVKIEFEDIVEGFLDILW